MSEYKYKFSVVTAVYKVEEFLKEAIESVINQTIGIQNIQFILVDDGTPDNSGAICDEYAAKYPNNIFVIHKENGGVSSARNAGLDIIEGKYVNFLDSDDSWDVTAFEKVWTFFEEHQRETDIVALPLIFFDAVNRPHTLNYKFNRGNRVVDLNEEWNSPQLHVNAAFFKKELFENGKNRFKTILNYSEDANLIQHILMEKQTIGLLRDAIYNYRKRSTGIPSAIQGSFSNTKWYTLTCKNHYLEVMNSAKEKLGYVPRWIQMAHMYDLQWRIKRASFSDNPDLTKEEQCEYLNVLSEILKNIDDSIIMHQRYSFMEHKMFALQLKYGKKPEIVNSEDNFDCGFSDVGKIPLKKFKAIVDFLSVENDTLSLSFTLNRLSGDYKNFEIYLIVNNKKIPVTNKVVQISVTCLDVEVMYRDKYSIEVPLEKGVNYVIQIGASFDGKEVIFDRIGIGHYVPLSGKFSTSYFVKDKRVISVGVRSIYITKYSFLKRLYREAKFMLQIGKHRGIKAILFRTDIHFYRFFKRKPIWLISDRASVAGDNGEAFFRYVRANCPKIDARFVLLENADDYKRLKAIGPVVKNGSYDHKRLALASEYIISSHGEPEIFNPTQGRVEIVKDIWMKTKFVFLQHGVITGDLSGWLNRYNKNFYGFVTSAKAEQNSIINDGYFYTEKEVWLTGLPRFDRLNNAPERKITVVPTWRKYLTIGRDEKTDIWGLIPDFEESAYFKFYNGLINDKRLIDTAKKLGYSIEFFLHPILRPHIELFDKNDMVEFLPYSVAYKDVYSQSSLVVTDYSSAVFDFAYLRKPIVYAHFDIDEFFGGGHRYSGGYFDYERDGFGEVEYDLDSTVNCIIEYMENDCKLKDKYKERIDNFFAFDDRNNCKRVYEKLISK